MYLHCLYEKKGGYNYAGRGDEFYTRYSDIENELSHYWNKLKGSVVYCNCDNPKVSQFYKYFKQNFHEIGLRGLYSTYYSDKPCLTYYDGSNETIKPINSGKFQDNESIMSKCDVVVTNPPFSKGMSSELITMANKLGKHVIMVGPSTMTLGKNMYDMMKNGKLNYGYTNIDKYNMPDGSVGRANTSWYTTYDIGKDKPLSRTGKKYSPDRYQKADNIDAILTTPNDIPDDYYGNMAVTHNFLKKMNTDEFEHVTTELPVVNGKNGFRRYIIRRRQNNESYRRLKRYICEIVKKTLREL